MKKSTLALSKSEPFIPKYFGIPYYPNVPRGQKIQLTEERMVQGIPSSSGNLKPYVGQNILR